MQTSTLWFEAQSVPREDRFSVIIKAFWQEVQLAIRDVGTEVPEGAFEFEQGASRVEGIVLHEQGVAAFRVLRCMAEKNPKVFLSELILARPATQPPVLSIRAWRQDLAGAPVSGGMKHPGVWDKLILTDCLVGPRQSPRPVPSFRELRHALTLPVVPTEAAPGVAANEEELRQLSLDRDYFQELSESQAEQLRAVEVKLAQLKAAFRHSATEEQIEAAREEALSLKELPVWAVENEARIVLLPRALAGARRSQYQTDADIYRSLEFLAGPYRDQRLNTLDMSAYQDALQAMQTEGYQLARSVDPSVAGTQGEDYFVRYGARRRFLDWHIVKGGGRDERYCLRIYFFWDDADKVVVVGSLPAHLSNSLS